MSDIEIELIKPDDFDKFFHNESFTKVVQMGNITELMALSKKSDGCPCRKIDKDCYVDTRTGEVFKYQHIENRSGSLQSIRHTLQRIRELINTNVVDVSKCRWVTLTYSENMTDTDRLYHDYEKFWKRFCYWCKKNGYSKPEYITVQEPQGRGAWHIHAFFIWRDFAPFIPNNDVMERLWRFGWTKTKSLNDIDNIGAYFSAYLGDIPLDEVKKLSVEEQETILNNDICHVDVKTFTDENQLSKTKKFVKGGRLHLYPSGMNIVRCTKGIKKPDVTYMTLSEAKEKVRSAKQTFSRCYNVVSVDTDANGVVVDRTVVNTVYKSYYNSQRK